MQGRAARPLGCQDIRRGTVKPLPVLIVGVQRNAGRASEVGQAAFDSLQRTPDLRQLLACRTQNIRASGDISIDDVALPNLAPGYRIQRDDLGPGGKEGAMARGHLEFESVLSRAADDILYVSPEVRAGGRPQEDTTGIELQHHRNGVVAQVDSPAPDFTG